MNVLSYVVSLFQTGLGSLAAYLAAHVLRCLLPAFFIAGALSALLGLGVAAVAVFDTPLGVTPWTYPVAFFLLGIAHNGVRLGRKTYVIDMAGGDRRTDYVSVGNTVIGFILLMTGLLTPLVAIITPAGMLLLLSICGLVGVVAVATLPEVQ